MLPDVAIGKDVRERERKEEGERERERERGERTEPAIAGRDRRGSRLIRVPGVRRGVRERKRERKRVGEREKDPWIYRRYEKLSYVTNTVSDEQFR